MIAGKSPAGNYRRVEGQENISLPAGIFAKFITRGTSPTPNQRQLQILQGTASRCNELVYYLIQDNIAELG